MPIPTSGTQVAALSSLTSVIDIASPPTYVTVGFAIDTKRQIQRIARQNSNPWNAAAPLPGTYGNPRISTPATPVCALSTSTIDGDVFNNIISCCVGTDAAAYAYTNQLVGLGGAIEGRLVMTGGWPNGRVDVFALNTSLQLVQKTMLDGNFNWTGEWYNIGFPIQPSAAVACTDKLIDIVGIADNGAAKLVSWNGSAWGEFDLGLQVTAPPTIVSSLPGRIDILAVKLADKNLYHRYRVGTAWSGWELVGSGMQDWVQPAAASWGAGRIDVVVVGSNAALFHKYYDGQHWLPDGGGNWTPVGGGTNVGVGPSLCASSPTTLELFVKGTDNSWYSIQYNGAWTEWINHHVALL